MSHKLFTSEQESEIVKRYEAGESSEYIARTILEVPTSGVNIRNVLKRFGIGRRLSASAMNPVVTAEQKAAAVKMCAGGSTYNATAEAMGMSTETLRQAMRAAGVSLPERAKKQRTHTVNDAAFDVLTPESLYWMGFLFADGHISDRDHGSPVLVVGLSAIDRGHLEKLKNFLGATHAISSFDAHDSKPSREGGPVIRTGPTVYFRVRSKGIYDALTARGMVTKKTRSPVQELAESRDFWRGMFDGDGSIRFDDSCRYPCARLAGQENLMASYQRFLLNRNISLNVFESDGLWHIATMGRLARDIVVCLYKDATIFLDRKNAVANDIIRFDR